jgi:hypothetical protein
VSERGEGDSCQGDVCQAVGRGDNETASFIAGDFLERSVYGDSYCPRSHGGGEGDGGGDFRGNERSEGLPI